MNVMNTQPLFVDAPQDKERIPLNTNVPSTHMQPMGPSNTVTQCPSCQATVNTSIKHTVTTRTHIVSLMGFTLCCFCCIPYCMDSTRNTDHYCPLCDRYLGTYQK